MNSIVTNYTAICTGESVRIVRGSEVVLDTTRDELKAIFAVAGNVFKLETDDCRIMSEDELREHAEAYHRDVCRALMERSAAYARLETKGDVAGWDEHFQKYLEYYASQHPMLIVRQLAERLRLARCGEPDPK